MKDSAFGVIPIWNDGGTNRFLLVQSKRTKEWAFPKGHPEGQETELQSALRELQEETGISEIELIPNISYTDKYNFAREGQRYEKTVKLFAGKVKDPKVTIQEKEILAYKWADLDESIKTISFERSREILRDLADKIK